MIKDCYPCDGTGRRASAGFTNICYNCQGTGVSPTWELSDGSDPQKRTKKMSKQEQMRDAITFAKRAAEDSFESAVRYEPGSPQYMRAISKTGEWLQTAKALEKKL